MKKLGLVLLFGLILLTLSLFGCKVKKYDLQNELTVEYIIGDEVYQSATVSRGAYLSTPKVNDRSGFIFDGWYSSSDYAKLWEFDSAIYKDLTLYGRWLSETADFAEVTFIDGDETLSIQSVIKGKCAAEFLPEENKAGYVYGGWNLDGKPFDFFTRIYEDTTLNLVWKLEEFYVDFYCDGIKIDSRPFTLEDTSVIEPPVPFKANYDGVWSDYELSANNIRVDAVYTPSVYHIRYFALNEIVSEAVYTCEDKSYPELPQVPSLTGHTGRWTNFEMTGTTINVFAEYEKITYELIYAVDGVMLDKIIYVYSDIPVNPPPVPFRLGYLCEWESFDFNEETRIIINARYTPITHYITFVADNNEIAKVPFDVENDALDIPNVPLKDGYSGDWDQFDLSFNDKVVNAVYTPIDYKITFIADGKVVSVQSFNVENMSVIPPLLEDKLGFICKWEDYRLEFKDIVVNAIYVPQEKESEITFELSDDGLSYIVTGYNGSDKHIVIPQSYNDLPVKRIKRNAFAFSQLVSVEISDGIEVIEERAFFNSNIREIILPDTLKSIESYAFAESALTYVTLYGNIGEYAFSGCKLLESITVSENVKVIAPYALSDCSALKYLEFESPEDWAVSKNGENIVGNIPTNKLAAGSVAATLYEPMSNYYWIKKSAVL